MHDKNRMRQDVHYRLRIFKLHRWIANTRFTVGALLASRPGVQVVDMSDVDDAMLTCEHGIMFRFLVDIFSYKSDFAIFHMLVLAVVNSNDRA